MKVGLHYYVEIDGVRTMSDSFIMSLLDRAGKDGVLSLIFYGDSKYTKEMFLSKLKTELDTLFFAVTVDDELAGFGLCDNIRWDHCDFHFCVFSEFWGKPETVDASIDIYRQLHELKFSMMYGVVPIDNEFALKFCEKIKLTRACVMPKYFYNDTLQKHFDGVMFYSVKE